MISWPKCIAASEVISHAQSLHKYFLGNITVMTTGWNTVFLFAIAIFTDKGLSWRIGEKKLTCRIGGTRRLIPQDQSASWEQKREAKTNIIDLIHHGFFIFFKGLVHPKMKMKNENEKNTRILLCTKKTKITTLFNNFFSSVSVFDACSWQYHT